ncbi:hypothetical protein Tco_0103105, partial [Tanacetum coccineum]
MINKAIKDSKAYKTYYDFATRKATPKKARKYKKVASPSRILSLVLEAEPVKKAKRVKRPAKKSTNAPTAGVVIKDTYGVSVSKKKAPAKADRGKGIELLLNAALLEDAQLKKAIRKSRQDTHKLQASGSRVLDVLKANSSDSDNESWGDRADESNDINDNDNDDDNANDDDSENEDDDGNDAHDSKRTNSDDDDENPSFTLKDYDKEEHDEEYESNDDNENVFEEEDDDLYKDVDVRSLGVEHEKKGKKTESSKQSSSISSDMASKFLILDNVSPVVDEVASMMNVKSPASLTKFELLLDKIEKSKSYQEAPEHRELYDGLVKSYNVEKDLFSSYGN